MNNRKLTEEDFLDSFLKIDGLLKSEQKKDIKRAIVRLVISLILLGAGAWLVISQTGFNWKIALGAFLLLWANNVSIDRT